jgi:hypothetical protein
MILNKNIEQPYNKFANDIDTLPSVSQAVIKSKLSKKIEEISIAECDNNIEIFSDKLFNKYFKISENATTKQLKENKLLLKKSKI